MVQPGESAIVALIRSSDPEIVAAHFKGYGGRIIRASLTPYVAARVERYLGGVCQFGRVADVDLIARVDGIEVRHVAMLLLGRFGVPILEPFLQLARFANPVVRKSRACLGELSQQVCINAKAVAGVDRPVEQVAQDLPVHRRSGANGRSEGMLVLRR